MRKILDINVQIDLKKTLKVLRITKELQWDENISSWKNAEFQDERTGLIAQRVALHNWPSYEDIYVGGTVHGEIVIINKINLVRFYWESSIKEAILNQKYKFTSEEINSLLDSILD